MQPGGVDPTGNYGPSVGSYFFSRRRAELEEICQDRAGYCCECFFTYCTGWVFWGEGTPAYLITYCSLTITFPACLTSTNH